MIRFARAISVAASVVACSTPIKLDNLLVKDRSSFTAAALASAVGSFRFGGQSPVIAVNTSQIWLATPALPTGRRVYSTSTTW